MILILNTDKVLNYNCLDGYNYLEVFIYDTDLYSENENKLLLNNYNDFYGSILQIFRKVNWWEINFVISCHEYSNLLSGYIRDFLGINGHSFSNMLNFTNKYIMKKKLYEAGLPVTKFYKEIQVLNKEYLSKPFLGAGCIGIKEIFNFTECNYDSYIEEKLNVKSEFHIDSIIINGEVKFSLISNYISPLLNYREGDLVGSYPLQKDSILYSKLEKLNRDALKFLGARSGVFHLEALFDVNGNLFIGEIGARPGGAGIPPYFKQITGSDIWDCHLMASLDREININNKNIFDNIGWFYTPINILKKINIDKIIKYIEANYIEIVFFENYGDYDKEIHSCSRINNSLFLVKALSHVHLKSFMNKINKEINMI